MKDFIKKINKYIILLIVSSLFGMPWFYFRHLIFKYNGPDSVIESIPLFIDYAIRLAVICLLIIDFKKEHIKNVGLTCIAALFYPLLGIVIFSILLIENNRQKASA
ncbi:MAG: hypothetical protein AB7S50_03570 [Bacteroidales bacterium]